MIRKTGLMLLFLALMGLPLSVGAVGNDAGAIPPGEAGAKAILEHSPRHHEWVDIDPLVMTG